MCNKCLEMKERTRDLLLLLQSSKTPPITKICNVCQTKTTFQKVREGKILEIH